MNRKVSTTEVFLDAERNNVRNQETNMGDLVIDAMRDVTGVQVALLCGGTLRASWQEGDIIMRDIYKLIPFVDFTKTMMVPGSILFKEMEFSLALIGKSDGGYLQYSGMTVTYDPDAEPGNRVRSIQVDGEDVQMEKEYTLIVTDFMASGGDSNIYLKDYETHVQEAMQYIVEDYLKELGTITESSIVGGRLVPVQI